MTRQHFKLIAATLKALQPQEYVGQIPGQSPAFVVWRAHVDAMADMCADTNPLFRRAIFIQACGVGGHD